MPYPPILTDQSGRPIPQIWDASLGLFVPYTGEVDPKDKPNRQLGKVGLVDAQGNPLGTSDNPIEMKLSGSIIEPRGSLANRPAPDDPSVTPYVTVYWAMDDGWTYGSDGTSWHKLVEVNSPWT